MAVKYVKDFSFPATGGFHGDVQRYAKGGHVTKVPAKAKASAKGVPARAKPNAPARGAPKMESKPARGRRQGYASGGAISQENMARKLAAMNEAGAFDPYAQRSAAGKGPPGDDTDYGSVKDDFVGILPFEPLPPLTDDRLLKPLRPLPKPEYGMVEGTPFTFPGRSPSPEVLPEQFALPEEYDFAPPRLPEPRYMRDAETRLDRGVRPGQMARRQRTEDRINAEREAMMRPRRGRPAQEFMKPYMPVHEPYGPEPLPAGFVPSVEARYAKGGKVAKVMREYKKGELHSGSKKGPVVKDRKQAMAIALSEAGASKKAEGGVFNDENLAYKSKGPKTRYTPAKGRRMARERAMERRALDKARHAEKYAPGLSLDMPDKKANGGEIKKAVHKHERSKHPGESLTKLRKGGVPSYGRKPMYGGD